jgi:hypothetical protein
VTVKEVSGEFGSFSSDDFRVGAMIDAAATGDVIVVDGVRVEPGDIIVGDGTGVVCLPRRDAAKIVGLAEEFARDDASAREDLKAGLTFSAAMAKYKKI